MGCFYWSLQLAWLLFLLWLAIQVIRIVVPLGAVYGAFIALRNYFVALAENVRRFGGPGAAASTSTEAEPAQRSYFFGKGYRDLLTTIHASWTKNLESFRKELSAGSATWGKGYLGKAFALLRWAAGISVLLFGTVAFLVFSVLHVTVLLTSFLLIYLGFTLLWLSEKAYLGIKGFFTVCPVCHEKMPLPEYLCPTCDAVHKRLIPSSYGILYRTCQCGTDLPTTSWAGRSKIRSRCPNPDCQHLLSAAHMEARKHFVAVYGGPAVGKSAFLTSAVAQLIDRGSELGVEPFFLDAKAGQDFERLRDQLERGRAPDKTRDTLPRAFNLELRRAGKDPRLLYLYDPAGELFATSGELGQQRYQSYTSGFVLLVDPFSLPEVRRRFRSELAAVEAHLAPSRLAVEDAVGRFFLNLEENFGLAKTGRLKTPVAVVINKVDALGLEAELAALEAGAAADAPSPLCTWLRQQGAGDWVHQLEARCARLRWFRCSSLGRMPDGSSRPFAGRGVLEPLIWILGEGDAFFRPRATSNGRKP
jgi:hypothetical protein